MQEPTLRAIVPAVDVYVSPTPNAELDTQILFGEQFEMLVNSPTHLKVRTREGKVGYIKKGQLRLVAEVPTHRISSAKAVIKKGPNISAPSVYELSMNSLIRVIGEQKNPEGKMLRFYSPFVPDGVWVYEDQTMPIGEYAKDFVTEALKFVGWSYDWGTLYLTQDCSALLFSSLGSCGRSCPRDSGPQFRELGEPIEISLDLRGLRRGDLVFWQEGRGRHVAIMVNPVECVHASIAPPRITRVEPLVEVAAFQLQTYGANITGFKRFPWYEHY